MPHRLLSIFFLLFSKIGEEQSAEDAEDGPPELLVSHSAGQYVNFLRFICII